MCEVRILIEYLPNSIIRQRCDLIEDVVTGMLKHLFGHVEPIRDERKSNKIIKQMCVRQSVSAYQIGDDLKNEKLIGKDNIEEVRDVCMARSMRMRRSVVTVYPDGKRLCICVSDDAWYGWARCCDPIPELLLLLELELRIFLVATSGWLIF